jgi:predicted Ser/Thr protein kinase
MTAVDPRDETVLTSALADAPCSYPVVKRYWERDRLTDETVLDFLVRHEVMPSGASQTIQMIAKGYLRIDPKTLVRPDALRKLSSISSAVVTTDQPTAHQSVRPIRPTTAINPVSTISTANGPTVAPKSRIGQKMGRCLITRFLGEGGGGIVYEGLHQGLGIPVAVKVIKDDARGHCIRQALRAEARLLAHLDHPNIVRVFDFDEDGPVPFLVMELVDGQTLADQIRQMGALRVEHAAGVIAQTARGLEAARQAGVIHPDMKPSNILIAKSGAIKIADLGLAVSNRSHLREECGVGGTEGAGLGGTYAYVAPERFSSRGEVEYYSDLYSLA